jgi:hypothetical protein
MSRVLSITFLSAIALCSSALACPPENFQVGNVTLSPDGVISRFFYVERTPDGQRNSTEKESVPVVRDRIRLEAGDLITLNSRPQAMDALFQVEVREKAQDRDEKGVFSTTYFVKEIQTPTLDGSNQKSIEKSSVVTVKSNYLGQGTYSKGCGEIVQVSVEESTQ